MTVTITELYMFGFVLGLIAGTTGTLAAIYVPKWLGLSGE